VLPPLGARVVVRVVDFDRFYNRLGRVNGEHAAQLLYNSFLREYDGKIATVTRSFHDVTNDSDVVQLRFDGTRTDTSFYAEDIILEHITIEEDFL
jgi:hypothetical protein